MDGKQIVGAFDRERYARWRINDEGHGWSFQGEEFCEALW
jgi:hypothetical protein